MTKRNKWAAALGIGGIAAVAAVAAAVPSAAALRVGARAPMFVTEGALAGKPFKLDLTQQLKKGPVVLFFFPKVFTKGCTVEANAFSEATPEFAKHGATVIGMSADTLPELAKFSTTECRDKFAVARATPAIAKAYGVRLAVAGVPTGMTNRTSFVIDQKGVIRLVHSDMKPNDHVRLTLAAVAALHK